MAASDHRGTLAGIFGEAGLGDHATPCSTTTKDGRHAATVGWKLAYPGRSDVYITDLRQEAWKDQDREVLNRP